MKLQKKAIKAALKMCMQVFIIYYLWVTIKAVSDPHQVQKQQFLK